MHTISRTAIALAAAAFATQAAAQVTLYDRETYEGNSMTTSTYRVDSVNAASLIVRDRNLWEVCDGPGFQGFCTRLLPGHYPSIASMGHRNRIASIRMINEAGPDARPGPSADAREQWREDRRAERREERDFRRRGGERLYDVPVANVGRSGPAYQDVQRCTNVSSQTPAYWEVSYFFRGQEHRIQMSAPPGPTIQVNEAGEPRA